MPAPLDPAKLDHAIQLYLAGEPEAQILATVGIGCTTLHRERNRRGIPPRRELALPVAEIAAAYEAGESEYSLGLRYGVSRNVIRRRLEETGVEIRSMSKAGKVRASKMTRTERAAQLDAAHKAWRKRYPTFDSLPARTRQCLVENPTYIDETGKRRYTHEFLVARALLREKSRQSHSEGDLLMEKLLQKCGLAPVAQKAISKYNVDVAVAPVAVEVLGGTWHLEKRHHAVRTPKILDEGWHLVFVWNNKGTSPLTEKAADYVIAFLDEIRRDPPAIGQYRVITGNGQLLATGSREDDKFPLVPPPRGGQRLRP
jgi:very-short-patch-repair endonuclease